jgi:hypothetical protein
MPRRTTDDAIVGLLELLRDVGGGALGPAHDDVQRRAREAVARGTGCLLASQVVVDGQRTVWCAQHDPLTLQPVGARAYEHASLSGLESAGIVRFLMELEDSRETRVRDAVDGAVAWLRANAIHGYVYTDERDLVAEKGASPLWARFHEIGTNRPIFSNRDGVVRYDWRELDDERRRGYAWYTDRPASVLGRYAAALAASTAPASASVQAAASVAESDSRNALPVSVETVLASPDRLELLSLEPATSRLSCAKADDTSGDGACFHGWQVLGRTTVAPRPSQRALVAALDAGIAGSDGGIAICFQPRHAIRAVRGKSTVDLLICFECLSMIAYVDGVVTDRVPISPSPQAHFDGVLKAAGVTLAASDAEVYTLAQRLLEFLAAVSRNDLSVHERFWADELIYTSASGRRFGKADLLRDVRTPSAGPPEPAATYSAEDVRIQAHGDTAVVAFRLMATTSVDGKPTVARYWNTGTFVKRSGQWQAVAWQATQIPASPDGAKSE